MSDKPNRTEEQPASNLGRLVDTSIKGGFGLFKGGSLAYDLIKLRKDLLREAVNKKDAETLDAFFSELLNGESALEQPVVDAMIDDRDFHSLLRACVADIETEKREAYAALARSIACGRIEGEWKRHFILSLKDMSLREVMFLRSAYVAKHFKLIPNTANGGPSVQESEFLKHGQPGSYQSIAINNLTTKGFVHEGKLSQTGEDFVRACSRNITLTPAAQGYKEWSGQNVAIISYEIDDSEVTNRAMEIDGVLRNYQIKSSTVAITRGNQQQARMFSTQGILLLGQNAKGLDEHAQALTEYASKVPLVVVQVSEHFSILPPDIAVAKMIGFEADFKKTLEKITAAILEFRNPTNP